MDHPYENTMLLPANYAVIPEDEMTYLGGGEEIILARIGNTYLTLDTEQAAQFCMNVVVNFGYLLTNASFNYISNLYQSGKTNGLSLTGTIYHNTTYILLQPLALAAFLLFLSLFELRETMPWGRWLALVALLTVATAIKPSYLFAFAPALLIALVVDLIRTRGRALRQEVWLGCTVLPGILLCIVQAKVLFTGDSTSGIALIFGAEFDPERMKWGVSNYYAKWALLRSFVFVGAVFVLLIGQWQRSFGYRFSLLLFAVALCEGLCLTETGERMYDGNLWWGSFICYYLWLLASLAVWLRGLYVRRTALGTGCTAVCGAALAWHIVSGVAFLVMMLAGISYAVMLGTGGLLLQEMWSMTL